MEDQRGWMLEQINYYMESLNTTGLDVVLKLVTGIKDNPDFQKGVINLQWYREAQQCRST